MAERDRLFARHPQDDLRSWRTWVGTRRTSGGLGGCSTSMPNLYTEVGAVLYDLGRQPRTAHDFFVKYQDRLLFGKDSYQPDEYPYYWRVFETNDEYFDYYRDYHAFWKLYGIGLPDAGRCKKLLLRATRSKIVPGLPRAGCSPLRTHSITSWLPIWSPAARLHRIASG